MILTFVGLIFFILWTIVPFFWMFLASVKTNKEIYQEFTLLPRVWTAEHYVNLFSTTGTGRSRASAYFSRWLLNSALVGLVVTVLSIVLGALGRLRDHPAALHRPVVPGARADLHLPDPGIAALHPAVSRSSPASIWSTRSHR